MAKRIRIWLGNMVILWVDKGTKWDYLEALAEMGFGGLKETDLKEVGEDVYIDKYGELNA